MRIPLFDSWVLTDEHPRAAKEKPVLIDLETRKTYQAGDRIMGVSAQQVVSLMLEMKSKNYFLPEEMHFISRFKEEGHESIPAVQAIWAIGESLSMKNRIL